MTNSIIKEIVLQVPALERVCRILKTWLRKSVQKCRISRTKLKKSTIFVNDKEGIANRLSLYFYILLLHRSVKLLDPPL